MYYRQPQYYDKFKCVGGDCLDNCCYGWRINWNKEEVEKLKNAPNISTELKALVEKSFIPNITNEDWLLIKFDKNRNCPFQTDDRLCKIQCELGAEYLSHTCTTYPRSNTSASGIIYRHCNTSCPEIIRDMLNNEKSMDLINKSPGDDKSKNIKTTNNKDNEKNYPEIGYRAQLFDFFYELISNKRIPLETAIILGALAAQKLTDIVAHKEYDRILEALKAFRKQFHNAQQLKAIEDIKPNYHLKFGFLSELIEKVVKNGATALLHDQTGTLNIDLYNQGEANLHEMLKNREFFLRNLALNLLFEFGVPFRFMGKTIFENYSLFVTAFGLLKLNLIAVCFTEKGITMHTNGQEFMYHGDDKLIGMTAIISRNICQNEGKAQAMIDLLDDNNFTTPHTSRCL